MPDPQPADIELRVVELPTPEGVLRGKIGVPKGEMRLSGLAPAAYALTNALVDYALAQEASEGRQLSCKAGCGACCRHMVPVSPPEAFYLADYIRGLDEPRKAELRPRFHAIETAVEERDMLDELLDPEITGDPFLPVARRYFEMQMPCPFLEDESCSIHAHRPVACRDFNVTSPAAWCGQPYDHDIAKVPTPLPLSAPLARLTANLTGIRPQLIPLSLVPRWTAEHADLGEKRYPGPELFDQFLAEIGGEGE